MLPRIKEKYDMEKITDNKACQKIVDLVKRNRKIRKLNTSVRKNSEKDRKNWRKKNNT